MTCGQPSLRQHASKERPHRRFSLPTSNAMCVITSGIAMRPILSGVPARDGLRTCPRCGTRLADRPEVTEAHEKVAHGIG